jgi:AraC-like DNA-binding protein
MIMNNALTETLLRHAPEAGNFHTKIKWFLSARRDLPHVIERCILKPTIVVTVQGKKRFAMGEMSYINEAGGSILLGMDLPADCTVLSASSEKPYCSGVLELDASLIAQISAELPKEDIDKQNLMAVSSSKTDPVVLEAFTRLAKLLDTPEHIQQLAPLVIREIHYRLLISPFGKHIRTIHFLGTQANQIARAIQWLEKNYKAPLKVEKLAGEVNMAVSTFHRNFKLVTTLSPLQFQKKLRLFEAQRLMLAERMDAEKAAYEVGYESPTQFNREYKRMFGNSPGKDIRAILSLAS